MSFIPKLNILFFIFCTTISVPFGYCQTKVHLGISADAGAKILPIQYYNTLAAMNAGLIVNVENEQPNSLGLLLGLGFMLDPAKYKLLSESSKSTTVFIKMMQRNLSFSGLIVFPTRNESLSILAGIGMDYNMATDVSYNIRGSNSTNTYHGGMGLDSMQLLIDEKRRKLLPSASVGLQYRFAGLNRVKLFCVLRQNLLNSFEVDVPVYEISTGKTGQPATNYKPSYLKLGFSYEFW